jgi:hypothetical protein
VWLGLQSDVGGLLPLCNEFSLICVKIKINKNKIKFQLLIRSTFWNTQAL